MARKHNRTPPGHILASTDGSRSLLCTSGGDITKLLKTKYNFMLDVRVIPDKPHNQV